MADEREAYLQKQIDELEEETKKLAEHMEELAGMDCNFGTCIFDPKMEDVEAKIAEVQKRKKMVESMVKSLKECEA